MKTNNKRPLSVWGAVILSSLMIFISLGFCSSAISIYTVPVTEALGISRSAYATTSSIRFITTTLTNIFFGLLVHKFGTKRLMLLGFGSLITSSVICSFANGLPALLVGSLFLGIGISFTSTTMVGTIINRHCKKNTGTYLGIALAMNGIGAAIARMLLTPIINAHPMGFKDSYRVVALIMAALAVVMLIFFRESDKEPNTEAPEIKKHNPSKVLNRPYIIIALVCVYFTGLILQSLNIIADPHLKDNGISLALVTTVMSLHSIAISASKASIGFIYDRTGLRTSLIVCYGAVIISTPALLLVSPSGVGISLGFVYSLVSAIAIPLQTVMIPIIVKELFSEKDFNKALGIFVAANNAGYATTPVADFIFDATGSYDAWMIICFVLMIAIAVAMNTVISSARKANK